MRATLHTDVRVTGSALVDSYLGLRYSLTPDAYWLVGQLVQEERLDRLVPIVARLKHIGKTEAKQAVYALLGQLGMFGAVRIVWGGSTGFALRLRFQWAWCCRQPASTIGFVRALWRAYGWIFGTIQTGFIAARLYVGPDMPAELVALPTLIAATLGLHELGHIIVARFCRIPVVLLARPGYFTVMYKRPRQSLARRIALGGPLLAAGSSAAALIFWGAPMFINIFLTLAAIAHAASLLPVFADGKTIWRRS